MMKTYTAKEIAQYMLVYARDKGDFISNKKLQKMLYYAEGWHLAFHGRSLFMEEIAAWPHGPVVTDVYHHYKSYKWNPLQAPSNKNLKSFEFEARVVKLMDEIFRVYGAKTADILERMTHEEPPWIEARGTLAPDAQCNNPINRQTMKAHFKSLLKDGKE